MIFIDRKEQKVTDQIFLKETEYNFDTCLFFTTMKLSRIFQKIAEEAFAPTGLSPSHALILYIVNQADEMSQKEIGERLQLSPSTITRFVEKLEHKKYVMKRSQGKNVYLKKTKEGEAVQSQILLSWKKLHENYKNILSSDEMKTFLLASEKLNRALEEKGFSS